MVKAAEVITTFENTLKEGAVPITVENFTRTYTDSDYDIETLSGGVVTSGIGMIQPLSLKQGGAELMYLEQGLLKEQDSRLFVTGSIDIQSDSRITVGDGGSVYNIIPPGVIPWTISGTDVYKKAYIRIETGSTNIV